MSQTTKRALEASLKKLLLEKPLNKITINDITEDCGAETLRDCYRKICETKTTGFRQSSFYGAGDEARTRYLHLGKVALYRMSYTRIRQMQV